MFQVKHYGVDGWGEIKPFFFKNSIAIMHNGWGHDVDCEYQISSIVEPPVILPINDSNLNFLSDHMNMVVTWRKDLIDALPNAVFMPFGTTWINQDRLTFNKQNKISYLTSNKVMTSSQHMRKRIYSKLQNVKNINGFEIVTHVSPPRIERKEELLDTFKFSIVVENGSYENYFTEKIIDCFATKTIPIYNGCPNIGDFFDVESILTFNDENDLIDTIEAIDKDTYEKLISHVEKNYIESKKHYDYFENLYKVISYEIYGEGESDSE
jgi:hypothetical protein